MGGYERLIAIVRFLLAFHSRSNSSPVFNFLSNSVPVRRERNFARIIIKWQLCCAEEDVPFKARSTQIQRLYTYHEPRMPAKIAFRQFFPFFLAPRISSLCEIRWWSHKRGVICDRHSRFFKPPRIVGYKSLRAVRLQCFHPRSIHA